MAAESRRQVPLLLGLLAVLAAVAWWQFGGTGPAPVAARGTRAAAPRPARSAGAAAESAARVLARGVGLDRLKADRPAPEAAGRDPFRSGAAGNTGASAGPAPPVAPTPPPVVINPGPPPPPPGPPPIAVKFIGMVSRKNIGKVAILSDGKNVYYGREGEIVDGRWRIVSIGEESLQIEYVDGRGRQTVRLTG
jgi:hypothetical protein